jgi:hypothetical protein
LLGEAREPGHLLGSFRYGPATGFRDQCHRFSERNTQFKQHCDAEHSGSTDPLAAMSEHPLAPEHGHGRTLNNPSKFHQVGRNTPIRTRQRLKSDSAFGQELGLLNELEFHFFFRCQ